MESTKRDRRIAGRISWKAKERTVYVRPRQMTTGVKAILENMGFDIKHFMPMHWFQIEQGQTECYIVTDGRMR